MRKIAENDELTATQEKLVAALVQFPTIKAAAESVGITDRTARSYMKLPHVATAYAEIQHNITLHVRKQIEGLSSQAIQALEESLASPSHLAKIAAIKIVLDRLDPETVKIAQQVQPGAESSIIDPALLAYITDEEMAVIDEVMERARARKETSVQDRQCSLMPVAGDSGEHTTSRKR